ncbi:MAG TPA: GDSL-type esterase/lipase family protein [Planctomycetota bacterium]|nr:GDSL-type esterase/lipase family protein [Planctomycetota bacterium]
MKMTPLAILSLLFLGQDPPGATPAPKTGGWLKRHEGFAEEARKGGYDVLFQGDSITDGWRNGAAKQIWDETFGPMKAANFGISGDRTQHVLWRLKNGEWEGSAPPKLVVLMIGTNNIGQKDPEPPSSAVAGIDAILKFIHQKSETTKVLLLGVFPRGEKPDHPHRALVKELNAAIAKFDDGKSVTFLDIGEKFQQPDGSLSKDIMPDFLHLSPKGYQIWADAIKEPVAALLR